MNSNPERSHLFAHTPTEREIYETFNKLPYADNISWVEFKSDERVLITVNRNEWMRLNGHKFVEKK
jgi:hypothetical protein